MSCSRRDSLDLAAFAAEPGAPEWAEFRAHYPGCGDCSAAVAGWSELRAALGELQSGGTDHPADAELLDFAERPRDLATARRAAIEGHLASCPACRTELAVLQRFDFAALGAVQSAEARGPSLAVRFADLLETWLWPTLRQPAFAALLLGLLTLPLGVALWRNLPGAATDAPAPIAQTGPDAAPAASRTPAPEPTAPERIANEPSPAEPERIVNESSPVTPEQIARESTPEPEPIAVEPRPEAPPEPFAEPRPAPPSSQLAELDREPAIERAPNSASDPLAELLEPAQIASLLPDEAPVYTPQLALAGGSLERVRSTSVVRGAGALPVALPLGPEHVAATQQAAPTLYWHLSEESPVPVVLTLLEEDGIEPLLELELPAPVAPGLHRLALAEHRVRLAPARNYDWFVGLVPGPDAPDTQQLSRVALRYTPASPTVRATLEAGRPSRRPQILAAAGYWIDAFDELSLFAREAPEVERPAQHRAALLEQVGLGEVATALSR